MPTGCLPANYDAGPSCHFESGRACPAHAECPADDTCNGCACDALPDGGLSLRCSIVGCTGQVRTCTEVGSWDCQFPSGRWCPSSSACIADDGCNVCTCAADGVLACTATPCADAGRGGCVADSDCAADEQCLATAPGCATPLRCARPGPSGTSAWYCRCDGVTVGAFHAPDLPYSQAGPCPGEHSRIGAACATNADCDPNGVCDFDVSPGYCSQVCYSTDAFACPPDATCVTTNAPFDSYCLRRCTSDADCGRLRCRSFAIAGGFAGRGCAP